MGSAEPFQSCLASYPYLGAALLLKSHYERLEGGNTSRAEARLKCLMSVLSERRMAVSFEMVTG
jgi:hypothetical protein